MVDILIRHGKIVTMDKDRRTIEEGTIAIEDGRIVEVGGDEEVGGYSADQVLDARGHAVLPGLIDAHGHAGHGLVKTLAENADDWNELISVLYTRYTDSEFWRTEAELSSLERLRFGTTTGVSFLGGGSGAFRVSRPEYAREYVDAIDKVGIRAIVGVGPSGSSMPYGSVEFNDNEEEVTLDLDGQLQNVERAISAVNPAYERQKVAVAINTVAPKGTLKATPTLKEQAAKILKVQELSGMKMLSHGGGGMIKLANEIGMLGPHISMAHCAGLTQEEVSLISQAGASVVHCPRARAMTRGRCPVPELLDSGVLVAIGSDGNSPDRSFDLFADMRAAMMLQRVQLSNAHALPPGKVLEMITIDAARLLGLDESIGSIEADKRADIIMVDLRQPHLFPILGMLPQRIAYEASGGDVDTVVVDGRLRLRRGEPVGVDLERVLERAERDALRIIAKAGYEKYLRTPDRFWGCSSY